MRGSATIPAGKVPGHPDDEIAVEFDYDPGSAPTIGGPPKCCDPGDPPEIECIEAWLGDEKLTLTDDQDEAVTTWLYENYEFEGDDYDGPDYDD